VDTRRAVVDTRQRLITKLQVQPSASADIAGRDPGWTGGPEFEQLSSETLDATARAALARGVEQLAEAQELLWASNTYALLAVFQAIDAAGKDSTIKHVMSGVNPQGVQVVSFKQPSSEDLEHDFLWRISNALPARGQIGIFNRSHYEEVIALRVHPEWLARQNLPVGDRGAEFWDNRYDDINAFERHLDRSGTKIVKFFLHVSRDEQKRRFLARLDEPGKQWKFSAADVRERAHWYDYMEAYDASLTATSTPWAPWYVIPADRKHVMQAMVAAILVETISSLRLAWPSVSENERRDNAEARRSLESEPETSTLEASRA
jgi:PPK2 family polyphosphate:nucleotide phosphotransferase